MYLVLTRLLLDALRHWMRRKVAVSRRIGRFDLIVAPSPLKRFRNEMETGSQKRRLDSRTIV